MSRKSFAIKVLGAIFFVAVTLSMAPLAWADSYEDFEYTVTDGKATITKYVGANANVIVPTEINGYPTEVIGSSAFKDNRLLKSVELPNSITSIEGQAFYNCLYLESVVLPDSVTSIGTASFYGCNSIQNFVLPKGLTTIGSSAFSQCSSLYSIVIPDSVTSIGAHAFDWCSGLVYVTIPESVTSIGADAFHGLANGTSRIYVLSERIANLLQGTYSTNRTTIEIRESLIPYAYNVADGQVTLTRYFGNDTAVQIPAVIGGMPVTSLGMRCFGVAGEYVGARPVVSVTIPDSVSIIGDRAFVSCSALETVVLPDSVTSIGENAFYNIANPSVIYVESENVSALLEGKYSEDRTTVIVKEHEHSYVVTEEQAATCTEPGWMKFECTSCGDSFYDQIPAIGHSWDEGVVTVGPSYDAEGTMTFTCKVCGATRTEAIPPISKIDISNATVEFTPSSAVYTGEPITFQTKVVLEGVELIHDVDYGISPDNAPIEVGQYSYTIHGIGAYTGTVGPVTFEVLPIDISKAVIAPVPNQTYSGFKCEPQLDISLDGNALILGKDYEVFYTNNVDPGTAVIIVTGKGGFTGSTTVTFEITEAAPPAPVRFDGTPYRVVSASDPAFILDVAEVHPTAGANVSIWTSNGGMNQLFTFERTDDGFVVMRNVANGRLVLDAAGAVPTVGANVSTWTLNGGMNQKWALVPNSEHPGFYSIASASNDDFVLDAAGAEPTIGANVSIWYANGGMNQLWRFVPASDLAYADVEVASMARNYTGGPLSPGISVMLNGEELSEGASYEVLFDGSTNRPSEPGAYQVTVKGIGVYSGTVELGEFSIFPAPVAAGSAVPYHLASGFSDDFVLDVAAATPIIGANVSIWTDNGGENQLFTLELQDDGLYVLRNVANKELVLDAAGAVPEIGANVSTWSFNGGMNQKWVLIPSEDRAGYYRISSASNTDFVLDAAGAAPKAGANVSIWIDNGGPNQLWKPISPHDVPPLPEDVGEAFRIGSAADPSLVLEMTELSEGSNVAMWTNGIGAKQAFIIERVDDEGCVIHNVANPELVVEAKGSSPAAGANAIVGRYNGGSNQKWLLKSTSDGYFIIASAANPDIILDCAGAMPKAGANVSTWTYNGGMNQKWQLLPLS